MQLCGDVFRNASSASKDFNLKTFILLYEKEEEGIKGFYDRQRDVREQYNNHGLGLFSSVFLAIQQMLASVRAGMETDRAETETVRDRATPTHVLALLFALSLLPESSAPELLFRLLETKLRRELEAMNTLREMLDWDNHAQESDEKEVINSYTQLGSFSVHHLLM